LSNIIPDIVRCNRCKNASKHEVGSNTKLTQFERGSATVEKKVRPKLRIESGGEYRGGVGDLRQGDLSKIANREVILFLWK